MSLTKKKENKSSALPSDLKDRLANFAQETQRIETAYLALHKEFCALKERLLSSLQTLERITTHMSEGLMFIDADGLVTLFNPAASALLSSPRGAVLHHPFWENFADMLFGFSMREAVEKGEGHQRLLLTLNQETEIEVSKTLIPGNGILLLLSNRTEQQRMAKSLNQADRLQDLGEMGATLAHEIRNPLGAIEGFARLLKRDIEIPAQQRLVKGILEGTKTLNRLVTEVLDYARPLHLHFAPVDLIELVHALIETAKAAPNLPECFFKTATAQCSLSLDREKIHHVLLNILRNAFEAGATRIEILLTEEWSLHLKDNGKGISPKDLKKIFTPFFTTKAQGTGLGLAYSLAIIKAHDGSMEVKSEVGSGTEFIIRF